MPGARGDERRRSIHTAAHRTAHRTALSSAGLCGSRSRPSHAARAGMERAGDVHCRLARARDADLTQARRRAYSCCQPLLPSMRCRRRTAFLRSTCAPAFASEALVLGAMPSSTAVVVLALERPIANGTRIG